MAIDRIGNNAPPTLSPETSGPSRSKEATGSFAALEPSRAPATLSVDAAQASLEPLEQLRSGQVDLRGYLDLKVNEATAHLSALPPVELDAIRASLRDRLATDPALIELVRTATGEGPLPSDDA